MKLIFAVLYASLNDGPYTMLYKSSSADEIPERDVTYHLLCLLIIIPLNYNRLVGLLPEYF